MVGPHCPGPHVARRQASRNPVFDVAARRRVDGADRALALGTGELVMWNGVGDPVALPAGPISSLDWLDDRSAVIGGADGSVVTVDLTAGITTGSERRGHRGVVKAVAAAPSGVTLSLDEHGQGIAWPVDGQSPLAAVGPSVEGDDGRSRTARTAWWEARSELRRSRPAARRGRRRRWVAPRVGRR